MSPRTAEENRKTAGSAAGIGAMALIAAGVIAVFAGKKDVKPAKTDVARIEVVAQAMDVGEQPADYPDMTICYHRDTGVVIVALPYGHQWGLGENTPPLATADVDLPPAFKAQDLALRKWEFRHGALVQVAGIEPPELLVIPEPLEVP